MARPDVVAAEPVEAAPVVETDDPPAADDPSRAPWWRDLWRPVGLFAASRLATLAAGGVAAEITGIRLADALQKWDGAWFLTLIREGYPTAVPMTDGRAEPSTLCFFPLYPAAVRVVRAFGVGTVPAAFLVATLAGLAAAVLLWLLLRAMRGTAAADRGVALVCFFPGAVVFSMLYSEALMLALVAGCLLCLHHRRWVTAGALAALAGATRFNGLVLVLPCAWAAVEAVRRQRDWRALAAPVLAPLGTVAFLVYLRLHTGVADAYFRTQRDGWGQEIDPLAAVDALSAFARRPFGDSNVTVVVAAMAFVALAGVAVYRSRPPAILVVYAAGCVAVGLLTPGIALRPRFLLMAFPLLTAVGDALPRAGVAAVLGAEATLLGGWTVLVLSSTAVGP
jgi:hypothetical protein